MEEMMSTGQAYAFDLLTAWNRIKVLGEENRALFIQARIDQRKYSEYVALMTSLWLELYPKLRGRSEFSELVVAFNEYQDDFIQPLRTYLNPRRAIKLHMILREAMEKLGITSFEGKL